MKKGTKLQNTVGIVFLVVFALFIWIFNSGDTPSESQVVTQQISDRFDDIKSASPEIISIEHKSDSYVVFHYSFLPSDLEYVIRANTATFSKYNLEHLGAGTTGYVTLDAEYGGKVVFSCTGSNGVVENCRKQ